MSVDILRELTSLLPENFTRFAGASLSEMPGDAEQAVKAGGATLLASLMQDSVDPVRSRSLFETISGSDVDASLPRRLPAIMADKTQFQGLLHSGEGLVGRLLGARTGAVGDALSQVAGVKPSSALSIVSMLAPMLMGLLKASVVQDGLDRGGLTSLLLSQKDKLQATGLDRRLTSALGFPDLPSLLGQLPSASAFSSPEASRNVRRIGGHRAALGTIAVIAVVALLAAILVNRMRTRSPVLAQSQSTGQRLMIAATSVRFEPGKTSLDPGSQAALAGIADNAKGAGQTVTVTSYSASQGDAGHDELATHRAATVRMALVSGGVPESRIIIIASPSSGDARNTDTARVEVRSAPRQNR